MSVPQKVATQRGKHGLSAQGLGDYNKSGKDSQGKALDKLLNSLIDKLDKQKHGKTATYKCGCRCDECTHAMKEYEKIRTQKLKAKRIEQRLQTSSAT